MRLRVMGIAALLAALAVGAYWLDRNPIVLPTSEKEADPWFPARDTGHPVVLLVDEDLTDGQPAKSAAERRPDLEWRNVLGQVFGGCDVVSTENLADLSVEARDLLVLPRGTAGALDDAARRRLAGWVEAGTVVLVEAPGMEWDSLLEIRHQGVERRTRLPWPLPPVRRDGLTEPVPSPLSLPYEVAGYHPVAGAARPARPVASPGGRPMVWERPQGRGSWLILALDLAALSRDLRQGVPTEDLRLPHRPELPGPGETNDLVAAPGLLQADVAWLDAWLEATLAWEAAPWPWPRLWPAPPESDGWFLLTHDDEGFGDATRWMTRDQAARDVPSTVFLMTGREHLSADAVAAMIQEDDVSVGLHPVWPGKESWDDWRNPRKLFALGRFQPAGRLPSVAQQRQELQALLPDGVALRWNRNHYALWPDDVDRGWRRLVANGFHGDSSYGPDWGAAGWLFGSAMPFQPLAHDGRVFAIWEVPWLSAETIGDVDRSRLRRWLRANAGGGHGPVVLLFHPDAYGWIPSAELFRLWDAAPDMARKSNHALATLPELVAFWEARARCHLDGGWDGNVLTVRTRIPPGDTPGLVLPQQWRGRVMSGWEADWGPVSARPSRSYGRDVRVFTIPPGQGTLHVTYRPL